MEKGMWFIKLTIMLSIIFLIFIYMEWDRSIMLSMTSFDDLVERYTKKPQPTKRTVLIIDCETGLCNQTIKSILDQSVRVHDISINTNHAENINANLKKIATIHKPGTEILREPSAETVIIRIVNGNVYPYDSIENQVYQQ
jgi:MinD-like ATPase involved in chromosome partitioning or flagellar assembly